MTDQLSVLVVDDQALFREIAISMFEATGEFTVVAEAEDGIDAIAAYNERRSMRHSLWSGRYQLTS